MEKRQTLTAILSFAVLSIFCIAATPKNTISVEMGDSYGQLPTMQESENASSVSMGIIDVEIPVIIPLKVKLDSGSPGCSGQLNGEYNIEVRGTARIYYNPETGESFFKIIKSDYIVSVVDGRVEVEANNE